MDEENKNRIDLEDLPKAAEELTDEEAGDVQGGALGNTYRGTTTVSNGAVSLNNNTVGGSLS